MRSATLSLLLAVASAAPASGSDDLPGLLVRADDGAAPVEFTLTQAAFALAADESLHPALGATFTARMSGALLVERGGSFRFHVVARGGRATLRVGGREVGDAPLVLAAGELPLELAFTRGDGPALLRLEWSGGNFAREPVPARLLRHPETEAAEGVAAAAIERGRLLAEERGCVHCHAATGPSDALARASRRGPELTRVGARASFEWLVAWLAEPRGLRPGAVMPALPLTESERRDIAFFLSLLGREKGAPPTLELIPDGDPRANDARARDRSAPINAEELAAGRAAFEATGCAACHAKAGADLRDLAVKTSEAALVAYLLDPLAVDPGGRMPALFATTGERATADAATARSIARFLRSERGSMAPYAGPFALPEQQLSPPDPVHGQELVRYSGCLRCHELKLGGGKERPGVALVDESDSKLGARPLAALAPMRGCLADWSGPFAPEHGLKLGERRDLRAFVDFARTHPDVSRAPAWELARSLARFGCANCHASFEGAPRRELAESPPPLTVVGAKMRSSWLDGVLCGDTRVRPWLQLRMPRFGEANVRPLVAQFAAAAGVEPGEGAAEPATTREERLEGVRVLGAEGGLSCIGCHDFRDYEAIGSRGPDLTRMHARLRPEWFELWMLQPLRLIPGTSMPRYFDEGESGAAATRAQLARIWAGLACGETMPPPPGLVARAEDTGRSQPARRPLLQRTFMPDSSPASIAVALPGMVNYCFDAVECRVRYAWDGDFLDLRPQWAFKGEKLPKLLGRIVWKTTSDFGVRHGDPALAPALRFRGHRTRDALPELYYDVGEVRVDERIAAAERGLGLLHHFRVAACEGPVWFVAKGVDGGAVAITAVVLDSVPISGGARRGSDGVWSVAARGPVEFDVVVTMDASASTDATRKEGR